MRPFVQTAEEWLREHMRARWSFANRDDLATLLRQVRDEERERCAMLHENVNPASNSERLRGVPGADAMGAVVEYRDLIRGDAAAGAAVPPKEG